MPWGQTVDTEQYMAGMRDAAESREFILTLPDSEIQSGIEIHSAKDTDYSRGVVDYLKLLLANRERREVPA